MARAALDDAKGNIASTGYPLELCHFVVGKVEDTIPATIPDKIALLRLDTDWYESTKHEMQHLLPLVVPRGVLILDDYGEWKGARQAVDEYFQSSDYAPLLNRIDFTGRICVLPERVGSSVAGTAAA
jgi:O-methyltransferase